MRKVILCAVLSLFSTICSSQILNQDANGKSTIVTGGSSINIDIAEGLFKISHYQYLKTNRDIMYGIDAQGKNEKNLSHLFKDGNITPNTELSFLIGTRIFGEFASSPFGNLESLKDPCKEADKIYSQIIDERLPECTHSDDRIKAIRDNLIVNYPVYGYANVPKRITGLIKSLNDLMDDCAQKYKEALEEIQNLIEEDESIKKCRDIQQRIYSQTDPAPLPPTNSYLAFIYFRTGVTGQEFTYDKGNNFTSYDSRFKDTLNIGAFAELGLTIQHKMNYWGVNLGYLYTNNFGSLNEEEYIYISQDSTITGGILRQQKSFKAYNGNFGRLGKISINFDYLKMIDIGGSHYLMVGPYIRQLFSLNKAIDQMRTTLGVGINYINGESGKFLGGLYMQTNDLFDNSQANMGKALQVGLTGRFTLGTVFLNR